MDINKLKKEMIETANLPDKEFNNYLLGVGLDSIKTFVYGVITGIVGFVIFLWILWLVKG